jgi:hypothetical protein
MADLFDLARREKNDPSAKTATQAKKLSFLPTISRKNPWQHYRAHESTTTFG